MTATAMPERLTAHFSLDEFKCGCGCGLVDRTNAHLIALCLERLRPMYGPVTIISGARCAVHNRKVGGDINSEHLLTLAVDVQTCNDRARFILLKYALHYGFSRVGIAEQYTHLGMSLEHPQEVAWTYYARARG